MVSMAGTRRTYAPWLGRLWVAAAVAGAAYGIFLLATALASPAGDFLLAMPWWEPSFVGGLGAFLIAHLCYLAALWPLAAPSLAVPIWWVYAISQILITAGFYFGRTPKASDPAATPAE
jgi:uncharacterized membrane protein YhhN